MLRTLATALGGSCFLCRGAARGALCAPCSAELPRLPPERCPRCALPSPRGHVCGRCLADPPRYDRTIAALSYDFPADALVHALKFRGELALAPFLGSLLSEAIHEEMKGITHIVAVPLSRPRLRERGFNQAVEIARPLARRAGRPIEPGLLERSRETPPQLDLPWAERRKNVRGAFVASRALLGAQVAVVDDVMTTGATLDEIAGALKAVGALSVSNWVVARTLPPH